MMTTKELIDMTQRFRLQRRHEAQIDRYYGERERKIKLYEGWGRLCCCDICVKEHKEVYGVEGIRKAEQMRAKRERRPARFFYAVALVFALISLGIAVGNLIWMRFADADVSAERDR